MSAPCSIEKKLSSACTATLDAAGYNIAVKRLSKGTESFGGICLAPFTKGVFITGTNIFSKVQICKETKYSNKNR